MGRKVLVVDDSLTVRMYHRQILEREGFECEEAENGMEALETLQKFACDLALVDINMPVLDGYSFLKRLRAGEAGDAAAAMPVVMISTEAEASDQAQSYASGANLHLIKPVRPEILLSVVRMLARPVVAA